MSRKKALKVFVSFVTYTPNEKSAKAHTLLECPSQNAN